MKYVVRRASMWPEWDEKYETYGYTEPPTEYLGEWLYTPDETRKGKWYKDYVVEFNTINDIHTFMKLEGEVILSENDTMTPPGYYSITIYDDYLE